MSSRKPTECQAPFINHEKTLLSGARKGNAPMQTLSAFLRAQPQVGTGGSGIRG